MKTALYTVLVSILVTSLPSFAFGQTGESASQTDVTPPPAGLECSDYVPPEEREVPDRLAVRGVACFEAGNYLAALRHYRAARRLSDSNLLNAAIGRVFQELGYPFIARRYYRDYLNGRVDNEGRQRIEQRLATVEAELAEGGADVEFESSPPEAQIFVVIDDAHWEDLGRTPLTVRLTPGKRRFILQKEGYITQSRDVSVSAGAPAQQVDTNLVATDAAWGLTGRSLRRTGAISMALSVPLLATGTSLLVVGAMKRSDADELFGAERAELRQSGARFQQWGAVSTIMGVAALGTGIGLWLAGTPKSASLSPVTDEVSDDDTSVRFFPLLGPGSVGARLEF